jgi:hypothetical protein
LASIGAAYRSTSERIKRWIAFDSSDSSKHISCPPPVAGQSAGSQPFRPPVVRLYHRNDGQIIE